MPFKVYLGGPIDGLSFDESTDWRRTAKNVLESYGFKAMSPMRGKDYLRNESVITGSYEQHPMSSEQGILGRDMFDVRHCDALLINYEGALKTSIGSVMEQMQAYDFHKYICVVMPLNANNFHDHPFVRRTASIIVPTLEMAYDVLRLVGEDYV